MAASGRASPDNVCVIGSHWTPTGGTGWLVEHSSIEKRGKGRESFTLSLALEFNLFDGILLLNSAADANKPKGFFLLAIVIALMLR